MRLAALWASFVPLTVKSTPLSFILKASSKIMSTSAAKKERESSIVRTAVIATRLHLGHAAEPPDQAVLERNVANLGRLCASAESVVRAGYVAVDAAEKLPGYSLPEAAERALEKTRPTAAAATLRVLPVQPWGEFVPALNALVTQAMQQVGADAILFVSAETTATAETVATLSSHLTEDTLVVGAALPGHDFRAAGVRPLNGRTTPWNTLALWNVRKLALTGFQWISEGGTFGGDGETVEAGVEEVACIAVLQKLLGSDQAKAKLVKCSGCQWQVDFDDPGRREWHERKMASKVTRAAAQLRVLGLLDQASDLTVHHVES